MTIQYQGVKLFLYDRLAEAAVNYGVFPEVEGGLVPQNTKDLRLRCSFRSFKMNPASDSENILSGEVIAEILYEPGNYEIADLLQDRVIQSFSPGDGELQNDAYRILTSSVTLLDQKVEGKYQRAGVSIQITVWGVHED